MYNKFMSKKKVILIHGNSGGTADEIWFPYVKKQLEDKNIEVIAKTMPDNVLAREKYWIPFIENELRADEDTIIVGHSSGAVAAMKYAETHKIFGSVLIGASYTDLGDEGEKASGYFDKPWQWDAIKNNQNWIIQFASTDDPYIPIDEARYIHKMLGTEYIEDTNEQHYTGINHDKFEFPELVEKILSKL